MALPPLQIMQLASGKISFRQSGSGTPIVFLHGLAGNSRSWEPQFDHFAADHHVIAWDAPGYGSSDDFSADIDVYTDCLNQVLGSLISYPFLLVGHSMGGVLASRYAIRFPEHLSGLVLSCTYAGSGLAKGSDLPAKYRNRIHDLNIMSSDAYGASRAQAMLAPDTPPEICNIAANIAAETRPVGLENAARVHNEADNKAGLTKLAVPTLVISGALDPVVSKEKTDQLHHLVSGSQTAIISGAGHAPYLEKPERYNAVLESFWAGL